MSVRTVLAGQTLDNYSTLTLRAGESVGQAGNTLVDEGLLINTGLISLTDILPGGIV